MVNFCRKFERVSAYTGKHRYRQGLFGKIVVQKEHFVEEVDPNIYNQNPPVLLDKTIWKDANWSGTGLSLWNMSAPFVSHPTPYPPEKGLVYLSGRRRYRRSRFGETVVLQVEEVIREKIVGYVEVDTRWRDAKASDLDDTRALLSDNRYFKLRWIGPDVTEHAYIRGEE